MTKKQLKEHTVRGENIDFKCPLAGWDYFGKSIIKNGFDNIKLIRMKDNKLI